MSGETAQVRLLYLTCTEIIANYGIFDTQVKSLLKVLAGKYEDSIEVHFFSLMPVLRFTKWRIEVVFWRNKEAFQNLRDEMYEAGIHTRLRPLLSVYPFDTWRLMEMIIVLPLAVAMLASYILRNRINLLHCRSYHAGLLGVIIKKMLGAPYIFDPRSLWVEEHVLKGQWTRNSWSYRLWKRLEVAIVSNADACIVVSDPMQETFMPVAQRVEVIYTTASEIHFEQIIGFGEEQLPKEASDLEKLRSSHDSLFVFSTNSFNRWNNLEHLLARYKKLCQIRAQSALVIVTHTPKEVIYRAVSVQGIDKSGILIMNLTSNLVPVVLRKCDYGLLVMPDSVKSPGVMSVKFPEYLAAGLPVICDEYIGGAAHVIRQHKVGILLSGNWDKNQEELDCLQQSYDEVSNRCREVAETLFSVRVHADRYAHLYQEVIA
jgi:glycosyltransferase involved in cell wall biosynthesis